MDVYQHKTGFHNRKAISGQLRERRGIAAVEAALLTPLLLIVAIGVIEIGQFIVLSQMTSNASGMCARIASRDATTSTQNVEDAVADWFQAAFPSMLTSEISDAVQVSVQREDGSTISGTELDNIDTGELLRVTVTAEFLAFKWASPIEYWQPELRPVTSFSRRE